MNQASFDKRPTGGDTMSPGMKDATNYYQWTVDQFREYLGDHILDIGGGFGAHLDHILPQQPNVLSVDLSAANVAYLRERFQEYSDFDAKQIDFGTQDIAWLIGRQFDTIISLNVLEHIEDDVNALRDMHHILESRAGKLLLQVPAIKWLYGTLDQQAGHYRRYTREEVRSKLQQSGFQVEKCYYFNAFGVMPWFLSGRVFKNSLEADSVDWQIKVFNALIPLLRNVEAAVSPPLGQSVIAVASVK